MNTNKLDDFVRKYGVATTSFILKNAVQGQSQGVAAEIATALEDALREAYKDRDLTRYLTDEERKKVVSEVTELEYDMAHSSSWDFAYTAVEYGYDIPSTWDDIDLLRYLDMTQHEKEYTGEELAKLWREDKLFGDATDEAEAPAPE